MFEIKKAALDDLKNVAVLLDGYRQFYGQPENLPQSEQFMKARLEADDSVVFVAYAQKDGEQIAAGFVQLYPTFSSISAQRSFILNDLYVEAAFREQGIARALMDAAKEYGQSVGAKELALQTAKDNAQAQALYKSLGYQREDTFDAYYLTL